MRDGFTFGDERLVYISDNLGSVYGWWYIAIIRVIHPCLTYPSFLCISASHMSFIFYYTFITHMSTM